MRDEAGSGAASGARAAGPWPLPGGAALYAGFPAANVLVDRVAGETVFLRQDLRDTEGWWFWWCFGVRNAAGQVLTFQFGNGDVLGPRGPAVSVDAGRSWEWLGPQASRAQFSYRFPAGAQDVRFAFAIPYTQADWERFTARHAGSPHLTLGELCRSPRGRPVELVRAGRVDGQAPCCVLLTARHHACESVADFELEGFLEAVLADCAAGAWFRQAVEVLAIPFVDKDGVEDGDQGKNRRPRDHNRDYSDPSVHATVRAIRALVPAWQRGRPLVALDLHCPHIRGAHNEHVYFVGAEDPVQWQQTERLAAFLERGLTGPVPYAASGNLPFGKAWNTAASYGAGCSFARWARALPGCRLACSLEFPYANVGEWTVTPAGVQSFGRDLAGAVRLFLAEHGC